MEMYETEDMITEQLIKCVQCYPVLYSINSNSEYNNKNNEVYWDDIQKKIGIQSERVNNLSNISFIKMFSFSESWLKLRWQRIFTDYKKTIIYNHIHNKKVPTFKWAKHLNYIPIDLNGTDDIIDDDDFTCTNNAFHVTQQMLDDCDINETVTLETVFSKCKSNTQYADGMETIPKEQHTLNKPREIERISEPKASYERCEDSIFGELVVAMLKKLEPEAKKRAKKEIMNVLL